VNHRPSSRALRLSPPPEKIAFDPATTILVVGYLGPALFIAENLKKHAVIGMTDNPIAGSRTRADVDSFFADNYVMFFMYQ
jgi:hypothetical protein